MPRIVYSSHYNIGFFGFEKLHPFDSRKYGRAWKCLRRRFGAKLNQIWIRPKKPVSRLDLLAVHEDFYLESLRDRKVLADALELPPLSYLPHCLADWCVLKPMRWATEGTIIAAREALRHGIAVNLSGGYHHAKPEGGEGFCVYSDIGVAICNLREQGVVEQDCRVAYIDLDAHQGNGVCHTFLNDKAVFIFDVYNSMIYPFADEIAKERVDCNLPVVSSCSENEYLRLVSANLPGFLDSIQRTKRVSLAVYNAGTDVYKDDPLGGLNLSAQGILQRDLYVTRELRKRGIPMVMLPSGGYTRVSYKLIAESVSRILEEAD